MNKLYKDLPRFDVLCVDMKSFYSSVEAVSRGLDPLQTYLAVVGDVTRSGSVVLAASPKMKKEYGIKTGSRLYEIPRSPQIHIVEARMGMYLDYSMHINEILNRFAPPDSIHVYSVDESWVNLGSCGASSKLFGTPWETAKQIMNVIRIETGLPCSIGIGDNKLLSKVILDVAAKKALEGIAECRYEDVVVKLHPIPIKDIWGIGSRTEKHLHRMGIYVLGDIAKYPLHLLKKRFGVMGEQLYWHSHGIDLSPVEYHPDFELNHEFAQKGFSMAITLLRDYSNREEIHTVILELSEEVARRARHAKKAGRTVNLGIGYSKDEGGGGFSKSRSIDFATNITKKIYTTCLDLFKENYRGQTVRNIYVSLTNLSSDATVQLDIFEDVSKQRELGYVMDSIRNRFGSTAILRARSYTEGGIMKDRSGKIGGHKK
jgi:DNA polymerase V